MRSIGRKVANYPKILRTSFVNGALPLFPIIALQVLDLIKELCEDSKDGSTADLFDDDLFEAGGSGGDLSGLNGGDLSAGYHSDSESCVMTSGNSPFISKEARYNFLSRSGRKNGRQTKPSRELFPSSGLISDRSRSN